MKTVKIRTLEIGVGKPKVIVPLTSSTQEELLQDAKQLKGMEYDMIEWRVDHFDDVFDLEKLKQAAKRLREVVQETPILMTFRTKKEGGEKEIDDRTYKTLNIEMANSQLVDMIDVEIFKEEGLVKEIIDQVHAAQVKVIASNHDFKQTPNQEEIISRLCKMQDMGADVLKIALMPNSIQDVLTLLSATERMKRYYSTCPLATMAMGKLGVISRLSGEAFGSSLTFGAGIQASAPGQIDLKALNQTLETIHQAMR